MKQFLENLKTFISSPNDVSEERDALKYIIIEINETIKDPMGVYIDPILWENIQSFMPSGKSIQDVFNEKIENCKFFILILGEWYGSTEEGNEKGNTERELEKAIGIFKKYKKITILAYLKKLNVVNDVGPQRKKVIELRERVKKEILYKEFH